MWDFTVRGWRACDITDIEDLFEDQDTAKKPQRNVADLKSADLSIGKVLLYYIPISERLLCQLGIGNRLFGHPIVLWSLNQRVPLFVTTIE